MQLVQWFVVMRLGQNAVSAANDQGLFDVGFATAQACLNVARMGWDAMRSIAGVMAVKTPSR